MQNQPFVPQYFPQQQAQQPQAQQQPQQQVQVVSVPPAAGVQQQVYPPPESQQQQKTPGVGEDPRNLIVNYVPTPVTDTELRQLFEQFGELESARVILDRVTQHPKGYGFVKYRRAEDATLAMERMNGFEIHNKRLKVTTAKGPHNAAITNHTQKLQNYVTGVPPYAGVQYQPQATMQPQPVLAAQPQPQGLAPYVVVDGNMRPLQPGPVQGAVAYPPGYQPPVMFNTPIPLPPSNDPMFRESCRFSLTPGASYNAPAQGPPPQ